MTWTILKVISLVFAATVFITLAISWDVSENPKLRLAGGITYAAGWVFVISIQITHGERKLGFASLCLGCLLLIYCSA
jgi:hypothetical protein